MDASQAGSIRRPSPPSDGAPAAPAHAASDERAQSFHIWLTGRVAGRRGRAARPSHLGPLRPLGSSQSLAACAKSSRSSRRRLHSPPLLGGAPDRTRKRRRRDESLRAWAVSARAISIVPTHILLRSAPFALLLFLVPGLAPVGSGRPGSSPGRCCWN
jgi:hypothetical protein